MHAARGAGMSDAWLKAQPTPEVLEQMKACTPATQVSESNAPQRDTDRFSPPESIGTAGVRGGDKCRPGASGKSDADSTEAPNGSMPGQEDAGLLSLRTFERVWKYLRF